MVTTDSRGKSWMVVKASVLDLMMTVWTIEVTSRRIKKAMPPCFLKVCTKPESKIFFPVCFLTSLIYVRSMMNLLYSSLGSTE